MRELTKSTLSAGLALSLFGLQQMANAFRRSGPGQPNPAVEAFDSVTRSIIDQTGETLREAFHAGDKLQRGVVDLTFRFMTLGAVRPPSGGDTSGVVDSTREAVSRFRDWTGRANAPRCHCRGESGEGHAGQDGHRPARETDRPGRRAPSWEGGPNDAVREGWGPVPGGA